MKFALLGADDESHALVQYLDRHPEHEFVAVYDVQRSALPASLAGRASGGGAWEALLHEPVADAVLVATGPVGLRGEQLVALAKVGVPLLVVWPTCDVVAAYELEMIRRDTGAPLMAYIPGKLHPAIGRQAELATAESSPLGQLEQAVVERAVHDRSRAAVLRQFTRDVALLRAVAGDVNKIGAMGPSFEAATWNNLNVQMSGAGPALLRWSMLPPERGSPGRLVVVGSEGQATLDMPSAPDAWTLTVSGALRQSETFTDWDEAAAVIETFAAAFRGERTAPAFQEACRDVEIAATVERSLARGKTIELYDEEVSEEATFKGMMAVGGCGLLLLALLGLVIVAAMEGLKLPFREHLLWRLWPVYLLGPIVVFLLLQFLRLLFRSSAPRREVAETRKQGESGARD